eukprot:CAMPEP_0179235850 /NCGR_PEP_ID=MMETSP0797-20121207/13623_1 /TAXON_ID=47934 /ORGANISM="Dinophysis acuminata, Strain DAEP01" /LENGTH=198 /DNA_ID=CAMNT_0020943085 /DNA_START=116 /DNA_END=712 /DNA_ORIENTATION=-
MLFLALMSWVATQEAQAEITPTQIIGQLKSFRDAGVSLFESTAAALNEAGASKDGEKVKQWNDNWLSLFGARTGMTGLAADFVMNYLGRSKYHDANGPLLDALRSVAGSFPAKAKEGISDAQVADLAKRVLAVCTEGMKLFEADGALHQMLTDLKAILSEEKNMVHFKEGLKTNQQIRKAFVYLAGPSPLDGDDDEEL